MGVMFDWFDYEPIVVVNHIYLVEAFHGVYKKDKVTMYVCFLVLNS